MKRFHKRSQYPRISLKHDIKVNVQIVLIPLGGVILAKSKLFAVRTILSQVGIVKSDI